MTTTVGFLVNGVTVEVPASAGSLLDALRDHLGVHSAKDGCSPQGQCGCCTVWVDGQPRVACVTPVARVVGRSVTTVEGLPEATSWAEALCATGGSQCGFCTPGIIMRLAGGVDVTNRAAVGQSLLAHLCRCTGWQTIVEAGEQLGAPHRLRDLDAATRRVTIEGRSPQRVSPEVALGQGGFADDTAPSDALVAVIDVDGQWHVAETLRDARASAGKVQGRRTTVPPSWPIELPPGEWDRTLQTTWVEPAYLEPDATWCVPGGEPAALTGNGGAFGGKANNDIGAVARRLADEHGRAVRVVYSREDVVRFGAKRPPMAVAVRSDGSGVVRVASTPGVGAVIAAMAPMVTVEEVDVAGPPTSIDIRGAGWVEMAVVLSSLRDGPDEILSPDGARASAWFDGDRVVVNVNCGEVLDEVTLRSYCIGAVHQALGWVRSEGLYVDATGQVHDLTIRSFGILRAVDMPEVEVHIESSAAASVNGSDAVFAAVAAAAWRESGFAPRWPLQA
ncbi:MAG: 2Fe-2S iron-sulfur cluster-binding protein [Acidimicrobiia bacterium]